jgi:hypothetical protein
MNATTIDWAKVNRRSRLQRVLSRIFAVIYRRWLWDENARVLKVYGWRTALIEHGYKGGKRKVVTPCFWWLK